MQDQAVTPFHKAQARTVRPGAPMAPDLQYPATMDRHRPGRGRRAHIHLPGVRGNNPGRSEATSHTQSRTGPSPPGLGRQPEPRTPPPPHLGSGPSSAAELPFPLPHPAPPPGGDGRWGRPSPGPARSPQPSQGAASSEGDSRLAGAGAEAGPSSSSSSPPEETEDGDGVLTGQQDMARPATAQSPPPPPHQAACQGRRGVAPEPLGRLVLLLLLRRRRRLLTTTTTWRQRPHRARSRRRAGRRPGTRAHAWALSPVSGKGGGSPPVGRGRGLDRWSRPRRWARLQPKLVPAAGERLAKKPSGGRMARQMGNGWRKRDDKKNLEENQRWSYRFLGGVFSKLCNPGQDMAHSTYQKNRTIVVSSTCNCGQDKISLI